MLLSVAYDVIVGSNGFNDSSAPQLNSTRLDNGAYEPDREVAARSPHSVGVRPVASSHSYHARSPGQPAPSTSFASSKRDEEAQRARERFDQDFKARSEEQPNARLSDFPAPGDRTRPITDSNTIVGSGWKQMNHGE